MNSIVLGAFGLSTNMKRNLTVSESDSINKIASDNSIAVNGTVTHNGAVVAPGLLDSPISELGIKDNDMIVITLKRDGAE